MTIRHFFQWINYHEMNSNGTSLISLNFINGNLLCQIYTCRGSLSMLLSEQDILISDTRVEWFQERLLNVANDVVQGPSPGIDQGPDWVTLDRLTLLLDTTQMDGLIMIWIFTWLETQPGVVLCNFKWPSNIFLQFCIYIHICIR